MMKRIEQVTLWDKVVIVFHFMWLLPASLLVLAFLGWLFWHMWFVVFCVWRDIFAYLLT